jgi:hypothetical protein
MALLHLAALAALLSPLVSSSFELFAFYDRSMVESFYGLSSGCIAALYVTVRGVSAYAAGSLTMAQEQYCGV